MPKLDIFSGNALGPLLVPSFSGKEVKFCLANPPSSSENVNFAIEQTDRILVPYYCSPHSYLCVITFH
jgi:hypothetical protein